jgi:hypothetical protein
MVRISVLGDALKTMYNAEKRGKVSRSRLGNMGSAVMLLQAAVAIAQCLGCGCQTAAAFWGF